MNIKATARPNEKSETMKTKPDYSQNGAHETADAQSGSAQRHVCLFKIESNVPPPITRQGRRSTYPLREMKIGDSFFVPLEAAGDAQVRSACCYFTIRNNQYRFTVRKETGGCRVWRVKAHSDYPASD